MSAAPNLIESRDARRLFVVLAYIPAYVLLDWLIHTKTLIALGVAPWDPPAALSLALLIRYGAGMAPAVVLAATAGEYLTRGHFVPWHYTLLASFVLTAAYVGAAAVLLRYANIDPQLSRLRDLTWFCAVSVIAALVVAVGGAVLYGESESIRSLDWTNAVVPFWIGDITGIMVLTPVLLIHGRGVAKGVRRWRPTGEILLQAGTLALAIWMVFVLRFAEEHKMFYLLFLPLIWIAMRHGIRGATLAVLGIQIGGIVGTLESGHSIGTVQQLQLLMLTLAVTGLFLGMAVTERRRVVGELIEREVALNRALRFAAAGEMASALAHELNQPLSAISTYLRACKLLLAAPEKREELVGTMDKVVREASRAAGVVHRLREFFRTGSVRVGPCDPEVLVRDALEPLDQRINRHHIKVRLALAPGLPAVLVDRVQMELVIHNLALNAVEALTTTGGERREIEISAQEHPGGYVRITIQDSGSGVPPEMVGRLFQAFATSKEEGMGMGLVISQSIVQAQGGKLWYEPSPSGGASFNLVLPSHACGTIHS